jgi:hypothetical protein
MLDTPNGHVPKDKLLSVYETLKDKIRKGEINYNERHLTVGYNNYKTNFHIWYPFLLAPFLFVAASGDKYFMFIIVSGLIAYAYVFNHITNYCEIATKYIENPSSITKSENIISRSNSSTSLADEVEKLLNLKEKGAISEDEFNKMKTEILKKIS